MPPAPNAGKSWRKPPGSWASSPAKTPVAGCGPAYAALFLEALGDAGVYHGLPRELSYRLAAQMLAVWIFCFGALAAAKLLLYGCVLAGSRFLPSAFPLDFDMTRGAFYGQLLLRSAVTVTEGFIALFAGLALHSARAAIVTSFLLVLLTQANIGSFTMADSAVFPAVLTGISLLCALLSLRGAETRDLM